MTADGERYRTRLADMIAEISDGQIRAEDVLAGGHSLSALGLTSLARIRLIDAVEDTFGVEVDLGGDLIAFEDVDTLAALLARAASEDPA